MRIGTVAAVVLGLVPALAAAPVSPAAARATPATTAAPVAARALHRDVLGGGSAVGSSLRMVARITDNVGNAGGLCTGTVVSPNVVLTAAHCAVAHAANLTAAARGLRVQTGSRSVRSPGQTSRVSAVIPFPGYDPSTLVGDAALLVLSTPTSAPPVPLATAPADAALYAAGTPAVIAGWGVVDADGGLPGTLEYGPSVVQDDAACSDSGAGEGWLPMDPATQLCAAGAPPTSVRDCWGDAGGPLLAPVNGGWVQIGVDSFTDANCSSSVPDYFTRVDAIATWAQAQIATHPPSAAPPPKRSRRRRSPGNHRHPTRRR